jgi:[acyl-carrier-protein] S-malonyltransferase
MSYALVFPGQGSQFVGMGKELVANFQVARHTFEEASDAIGLDLKKLCFDGPESDLRATQNTQPALLTCSVAAFRALSGELELNPDCVAGHSLGEWSALVCAEALCFADAVRLVRKRGEAMCEAAQLTPGAMAAVIGLDSSQIDELCRNVSQATPFVVPANYNSPEQTVVSGTESGVTELVRRVKDELKKRAMPLPVSGAFHTETMQPAAQRLSGLLESTTFKPLRWPLIANRDGKATEPSGYDKSWLAAHVTQPVQWTQTMVTLQQRGVSHVIEPGAGKVLCGLIKRFDRAIRTSPCQNADDIAALTKESL